mmetsp:Transcript_38537/g.91014  ORF Transcript_38537/g.91014 Transcript_38537/m.91014 type:complete len:409 (+) Transcript_38537:2725-3951(+)
MERGVLDALLEARLEPREQEAQPVSLLARRHQRLHRAHPAHRHHEGADLVLLAPCVDQRAHHLRRAVRVDLLDIDLDELDHGLGIEVGGELLDHVVLVAHVDERAGVGELGLGLEVVLDLDGRVVLRLARDALQLLEVVLHHPHLGTGDNVLVVHVLILAEVDDGSEVVEQTLHALVLLEHPDEGRGGEELRVLGRDLDADLEVLAHVLEHLLEQLHRPLRVEGAEPLEEEVRLHLVGVHDDALEVLELRVVLQGALEEAALLAEAPDQGPVVVRHLPVRDDRLRHLCGVVAEVDLEELGLERALLGLVVLERGQQERSGLLEHVALEEEVSHRRHVHLGAALLVDEELRELDGALRVQHHHVLQDRGPLRVVPHALGVGEDLVVLLRLHEARDHLGVGVGLVVHLER